MEVQIKSRPARFCIAPHGIILKKSLKDRTWVIPDKEKRHSTKIKTFSRASAKRMREKLICFPDFEEVYGLTFTWSDSAYVQFGADHFKEMWQKFLKSMRYQSKIGKFSWFYLFWRIELTNKKTPHFHTIIKCSSFFDVWYIQNLFCDYIKKYYDYMPFPDVACNIRKIDSFSQAYSYVSSHASKHKREQLGWRGRQWGIVYVNNDIRSKISPLLKMDNVSYENLEDKQEVIIKRTIRRLICSRLREYPHTYLNFQKVMLKGMGIAGRWRKKNYRKVAYQQTAISSQFLLSKTANQLKELVS